MALADRDDDMRKSLPLQLKQEKAVEPMVEKTRNQEEYHMSDHYASIQRIS